MEWKKAGILFLGHIVQPFGLVVVCGLHPGVPCRAPVMKTVSFSQLNLTAIHSCTSIASLKLDISLVHTVLQHTYIIYFKQLKECICKKNYSVKSWIKMWSCELWKESKVEVL